MIRIPSPRNTLGGTTTDLLQEQISLCKASLDNISKLAYYKKDRELRDEINRRLRNCHNLLGASGDRRTGCLYKESELFSDPRFICEHAIPVTALVTLYQEGIFQFEDLVFFPVVLISRESDKKLRTSGLVKSGHDITQIFRRYHEVGIKIETHFGNPVDTVCWTLDDHWDLINKTKEINHIYQKIKS